MIRLTKQRNDNIRKILIQHKAKIEQKITYHNIEIDNIKLT